MSSYIKVSVITLFVVGMFAWQIDLWKECRQTNSWGYCMKVLSR